MKTTDDALYAKIRDYLQVHLRRLRNLSEHTVRSYANALTAFECLQLFNCIFQYYHFFGPL